MELSKKLKVITSADIKKHIDWLYNSTDSYKPMPLVAARLSRLINHMKSGKPFCFITAYRYMYSKAENERRNKELAADIRSRGYGFIQVEGKWNGTDEKGKPYESTENTFFVIGYDSEMEYATPYNDFREDMHILQGKYDQEGIICGYYTEMDETFLELLDNNGDTDMQFTRMGIPSEKELADMIEKGRDEGTGHTKLKNKKFIFSGIYSYRPNSLYMAGNALVTKYKRATGLTPITWTKEEIEAHS